MIVKKDIARNVGRPPIHESNAARQQAYRERLKADGKRVITKIVLDVRSTERPLVSDIIDLSQVRKW